MTVTRLADHLIGGDHASRPAANAVPIGTLYSCTDHDLVYQSDGSTWATWATLGSTTPLTTKGDLFSFSTVDARLPVGADGQVLVADSAASLGVKWSKPLYGVDDPAAFNAIRGATELGDDLEFDVDTVSLPSGWGWVNQGDSTFEQTDGVGYLYAASTGGSTSGTETHRMLTRTIPSDSSFRAFLHVRNMGGENIANTRWGIVLRESGSGKYLLWSVKAAGGWPSVELAEWASVNTLQLSRMDTAFAPEGVKYLQVRKASGSSWQFLASNDGIIWTPWWGGYDPSYFDGGSVTFDEIGVLIGVADTSSSFGIDASLGWFRIR